MKKLSDSTLELITGGDVEFSDVCAAAVMASIPTAFVTSAAALGCYLGAESLRKRGDKLGAEKCSRATKGLLISTTAAAGVGTAAAVGLVVANQ